MAATTSTMTMPATGETLTYPDGVTVENVGDRWHVNYVVRRDGVVIGQAFSGSDARRLIERGTVFVD